MLYFMLSSITIHPLESHMEIKNVHANVVLLLPKGGFHVMISPYMVVDGLTWSDITGPGAIGETCKILIHILLIALIIFISTSSLIGRLSSNETSILTYI